MSFTPPNVFVTATPVDSAQLQANFDTLRRYINRDIISADIKDQSVDTTDIVRGEYANVVRDHQFMTGDVMTSINEIDTYSHSFVTSHFKTYDLYSDKMQQIPSMGRRIVMEHNGVIFFTVGAAVIGDPNYELLADKKASSVYVQISSGDRILAADFKPATRGRTFTEDDVGTDVDTSGNVTNTGKFSRRWYANRYRFSANKGDIVNICLVVDPKCDKAHVSARNMQVEIFYR
jgi:hypothetical protein